MLNLRTILLIHKAVSGLGVNLRKSKLIGVGDVSNILSLASIKRCQIASFSVFHLDFLLGAPRLR